VLDVEHQSTTTFESITEKKEEDENVVVVVALTSRLKCGKKERKMRMNEVRQKKGENLKKKLLILFIPGLMYTIKMKFFNEF